MGFLDPGLIPTISWLSSPCAASCALSSSGLMNMSQPCRLGGMKLVHDHSWSSLM